MGTTNGNKSETDDRDVLADDKITSAAGGIEKSNATSPLVVEYDDLEFGEELGNGQFGRVCKAILNDKTVAVKQLSNDVYSDNDKESHSEIVLTCRIPSHPNIVRVLGFVSNPLCIVMNYMTGGTAKEYCYVKQKEILEDDVKNGDGDDNNHDDNDDYKRKVSMDEVIIILSKAANGIKF